MKEKRTLIERYLPVEELSQEAKEEKKPAYHPPISDMKFYWTRKPLITARAAILASILPEDYNIDSFKKDIHLNENKRAHSYDFEEKFRDNLRRYFREQFETDDAVICDPFSGGGSIPFEAMRMGLNAYVNDYNPLSWIILNATLIYPSIHKDLWINVEKTYDEIEKLLQDKIAHLYPSHNGKRVATYIYSWYVKCPNCKNETPLVASWRLFEDRNGKNSIYLVPSSLNGKIHYAIERDCNEPAPTIRGKKGICVHCGKTIENNVLMNDIQTNQNAKMIAVVVEGKSKKEFDLPCESDINALDVAGELLKERWDYLIRNDLIPIERIPPNPSGIHNYFIYWNRLFNPRQILLLTYFIELIKDRTSFYLNQKNIQKAEIVGIYLTILLGKHIGSNSRLSTYNSIGQNVASATSNKLNSIQWDHTEVNPFSSSSGSLQVIKGYILNGIKYANKNLINKNSNIIISNESAISFNPSRKFKLIVTDPPYKDDVPYGEFSDFFYVWESRALKGLFSNSNQVLKFTETPKDEEIDESMLRTEKFFEHAFKKAIKNLYNILEDDGLLVLFFAHSSINAWDFVINSLQSSGFQITATWPIHTEYSANVLARDKASITSSILIVGRKRKENKSGYIEEIQIEVEVHLKKRIEEFWNYGLRGADLTVSAMGATLDVITQYSDVKSYSGEMKIKDVLNMVQKYVAEYVLSRFIRKTSTIDSQTSFYLYARLGQLNRMPFDTANLIAKSLNIDLTLFEQQGLLKSIKSGKTKGIITLNFSERELIGMNSLIDAVHLTMTFFTNGGYADVERELSNMPYSKSEIKDILVALLALPPDDPERQISQKILERMGYAFPKEGQSVLEDF